MPHATSPRASGDGVGGTIQLRATAAALATALGAFFIAPTAAQPFPNRALRLVIPFAPGGTADIIGRPLAQKMSAVLGQAVVVENRGGAGGAVGATSVVAASPDGYTLLLGVNGFLTILPGFAKLAYDPLTDFAPIATVASSQFVLVAHPAVPAQTMKALLALAKAQPARLSFASTGNGTVNHVAGELLNSMAGIRLTHIPYKGTGPMMLDLLAGHVDLGFTGVSSVVPYIQSGKIKALGVTGNARSVALPSVPTIAEVALPGYEATSFWGLLAPAKTPADIVRKLNAAAIDALKNTELRDAYIRQGNEPAADSAEAFAALIQSDTIKWARVIKSTGIRLDAQ